MDIQTLDDTFAPAKVIDYYEACVWTERYRAAGDFVLTVPDNLRSRMELPEGGFVSVKGTREVMQIETRESALGMLTVSGPSLTKFLENRIARNTYTTNGEAYWTITGTPAQIANYVVTQMTISGLVTANQVVTNGFTEVIDFLEVATPASGSVVTVALQYGDVYNTIKVLADTYGFGFTLYPEVTGVGTYKLTFATYMGKDRTSGQSVNEVVRFSSAMDTLAKAKELRSIANFKNVAYAWAPNIPTSSYYVGYAAAPGVDNTTRNFNRRSMMVLCDDINAADIADAGVSLKNVLAQRARNALANNNYVRYVDGEIVPQPGIEYGVDYQLGDLIELATPNGGASIASVDEFIRSQDRGGYKAYPTLSVIAE